MARLYPHKGRFCARPLDSAGYIYRMTDKLALYYAPDNASLCVRLALVHLNVSFDTVLVDRTQSAQSSPAYLAMNPNGQIPTLCTPDGPIYETAAILLWLADNHAGEVFPAPQDATRGHALKWLFWLSNTLHPAMRMLFYPQKYIGYDAVPDLTAALRDQLARHMAHLEAHAPWLDDDLGILAFYLAPMLRWSAIYGAGPRWFEIEQFPRLLAFAKRVEQTETSHQASLAEGLGQSIFSAPRLPNPPEGSAL